MVYLDNAATTYPKPEAVYEALDQANRELAFNAGRGSYKSAHKVAEMIQETRTMVGEFVGVSGDCVSFESSATEALNIIINGIDFCDGDTVFVSPFEHNAIIRPLYNIQQHVDISIDLIPFDEVTWKLDEDKFNDMLAIKQPKAVFISHVSNVTGYILPYEEISRMAKEYDAITVLDCAQSYGVIRPVISYTDFLVFAGHKSLYASFGIAGFLNLHDKRLKISKSGGTGSDSLNHFMPDNGYGRYESGSLNSVAVAGLKAGLTWLKDNPVYEEEKKLTDYLIDQLSELDNIQLYLPDQKDQIFGVVSLNVIGYQASDVGTILSEDYDICVRTGYHCSPFVHDFIGSQDHIGTVRVSLSAFSTKEDVDSLVSALKEM